MGGSLLALSFVSLSFALAFDPNLDISRPGTGKAWPLLPVRRSTLSVRSSSPGPVLT
jgi:hypothetical protein